MAPVILKQQLKMFTPLELNAKVRQEKSQLGKIKSLYQLNRIPTAFHKLDFIAAYKHTLAQRGMRTTYCSFFFFPSLFVSVNSVTATSSEFVALWAKTPNMICRVMYGAHRRAQVKGLSSDLWPHAATVEAPSEGARRPNGSQCDSYHNPTAGTGNAKEH